MIDFRCGGRHKKPTGAWCCVTHANGYHAHLCGIHIPRAEAGYTFTTLHPPSWKYNLTPSFITGYGCQLDKVAAPQFDWDAFVAAQRVKREQERPKRMRAWDRRWNEAILADGLNPS